MPQRNLDGLRTAFWNDAPAAPQLVPDTPEARAAYEMSSLASEVKNLVAKHVLHSDVILSELASQMKVSGHDVNQILAGNHDVTLSMLARFAAAAGLHLSITEQPFEQSPD